MRVGRPGTNSQHLEPFAELPLFWNLIVIRNLRSFRQDLRQLISDPLKISLLKVIKSRINLKLPQSQYNY